MFDLPGAPRYRFVRAPLAQALAQVRFPIRSRLQTLEGVAPVQERLESVFPEMREQQMNEVSLAVGPAGPAVSGTASRHWTFTDNAGADLVLAPDSATLAMGAAYQGVEHFAGRLASVLEALVEAAGVKTCDRFGVRYLNLAETPPSDPGAWRDWFRPELLGWPAGEILSGGTSLITSITQTQLSAPPVGDLTGPPVAVQGLIRHGLVPAGSLIPGVPPIPLQSAGYLLDFDLFVDARQDLDPTELISQFRTLHAQIDRFFRWTLSDTGAEYFGLEDGIA